MGSTGTVKLNAVWELLNHCAPGHTKKEGDHYWRIYFQGKTYPNFPTGKHAKNKEIQYGHIKRMIRHLEIEDCARTTMPGLYQ